MKTWIKAIIYAVIAVVISTLTAISTLQTKHLHDVRNQVSEQSKIIDSLLTLEKTYFEVDLNVTDKSVSKVFGSHNKGTITMPSERTYRLVVDSTNVRMR